METKELFINDVPAQIGQEVTTFRGEVGTLQTIETPRKPGSTGRVYVKFPGSTISRSFFPGVIGGEWKDIIDF